MTTHKIKNQERYNKNEVLLYIKYLENLLNLPEMYSHIKYNVVENTFNCSKIDMDILMSLSDNIYKITGFEIEFISESTILKTHNIYDIYFKLKQKIIEMNCFEQINNNLVQLRKLSSFYDSEIKIIEQQADLIF